MNLDNPQLVELTREYQHLIVRIHNEVDADERKLQSEKLEELMETMFAFDLEQQQAELDLQSAALKEQQASLETRKTQREQIIKAKLEQILAATNDEIIQGQTDDTLPDAAHRDDIFAFLKRNIVGAQFRVVSDKTENGIRLMKMHAVWLRPENRTREVPFTVLVEQTYKKVIDGKQIQWTVAVPEQRTKTEVVHLQIPVWQVFEIEVPQGEDWQEIANKKLARKPRTR